MGGRARELCRPQRPAGHRGGYRRRGRAYCQRVIQCHHHHEYVPCVFSRQWLIVADMIPIIRCPRGNAAEMVARRLDARLRDHIASTSSRTRDAYTVDALQRPCE